MRKAPTCRRPRGRTTHEQGGLRWPRALGRHLMRELPAWARGAPTGVTPRSRGAGMVRRDSIRPPRPESTMTLAGIHTVGPSAGREYRPFPNEEGRNSRQGSLEVPLMIRALGL